MVLNPRGRSLRTALVLYIIFLFFFLIITIVFSFGRKEFFSAGENQDTISYLGNSPVLNFLKWDSLWYLAIAQRGYFSPESHNFAAPLFPWIIKVSSWFVGDLVIAGLLVNLLLLPILLFTFLKLLEIDFNPPQSTKILFVFLSFPFSFFLFLPFSETLFLIFAVISFYFARRSRWFLANLMAFFSQLKSLCGLSYFLMPDFRRNNFLQFRGREGMEKADQSFLSKDVLALSFFDLSFFSLELF